MSVKWVEYSVEAPDPVSYVKYLPGGFYKHQMMWHKMNERPSYLVFTGRYGSSLPVVLMTVFEGYPQLCEAEMSSDEGITIDGVPLSDTSIEVVGWAFHQSTY